MQKRFIYVARNQFKISGIDTINVEKWGIDSGILVNHFQEDLSFCADTNERQRRFDILNNITRTDAEPYEQTPFYAGLVTFEEDFVAIDSFLKNFTSVINANTLLKKCIIDLCVFDYYCACSLPIQFLSVVFNQNTDIEPFKLENNINKETGIIETLLRKEISNNSVFWTVKRSFFSKKLLDELVENNTSLLTDYCIKLIDDMSLLIDSEMAEQYIKNLFIQSNGERDGDFVPIICNLKDANNQLRVFETIVEKFPHNPHFKSHLARFYSREMRRYEDALCNAEAAIELEPKDPLLYHIKGTIYCNMIKDILQNYTNQSMSAKEVEAKIIELSDNADYYFEQTRELADDIYEIDSFGYVSPINIRVECIDGIARVLNIPKCELLSREPYIDWLDEIENLLEEMKRSLDEEDYFAVDCSNRILSLYDNTSKILQNLHNLLSKDQSIKTIVNRQISHVLFKCLIEGSRDINVESRKILEMMQFNIEQEPSEEKNYIIWFKAARMNNVALDEALTKINSWNNMHPFIDLLFYSYTLHVAKAIEKRDSFSAKKAQDIIEECKKAGRNDIKIREWLAYGDNVSCIVKNSANVDKTALRYVTGRINEYYNDGNATIVIDETELKVFFRPQWAGFSKSDLNRRVKFHLGFSYDGLRADDSSVERIS